MYIPTPSPSSDRAKKPTGLVKPSFLIPCLCLCLCLAFPPPLASQEVHFLYTVTDVYGDEFTSAEVKPGEMRLLGTFRIGNGYLRPFCLWVTFDNGGKLSHARHGELPAVRLTDMMLHYKDKVESSVVKRFADNSSNAGGHAYEVFFLQDDMQPVYEVELWGTLPRQDVSQAVTGGRYLEKINFNIEPLP